MCPALRPIAAAALAQWWIPAALASNVGILAPPSLPPVPPGCNYATIQAAINAAPPGSLILINPVTYTENLVIDKDLDFAEAQLGSNCTVVSPSTPSGVKVELLPADTTGNIPLVWIGAGRTVSFDKVDMADGVHNGIGGLISAGANTNLSVFESWLTDGWAEYGGGIGFRGPNGSLYMTARAVHGGGGMLDNAALYHGGSVYMGQDAGFDLDHAVISSAHWSAHGQNAAGLDGGAVYLGSGTTMTVSNGSIIQNAFAGRHGGCIGGMGSVFVDYSAIHDCWAGFGNGGAIQADHVSVNDAYVVDSRAWGHGGGIYARHVELSGTTEVRDHEILINGNGGGIYAEDDVHVGDDVILRHTSAVGHGGAIFAGDTVYVSGGAHVHSAEASGDGGVVHADTVVLSDNARVESGSAGGDGGAIWANHVTMLDNAYVRSASATNAGGLVYVGTGGSLAVWHHAELRYGSATNGGLVMLAGSAELTVGNDALLSGGQASQSGGLIYLTNGTATISGDAQLRHGTAGRHGGLMSLGAGSITTINSTLPPGAQVVLHNGTAVGSGGAIYAAGTTSSRATLTVRGNARIRFSSATNGGGIALVRADLTLEDEVVVGGNGFGNTAIERGGGIYASYGTVSASGTNMKWGLSELDVPEFGVRISHNSAAIAGGGVALVNGSELFGTMLLLHENQATGNAGSGGGMSVAGESVADFEYVVFQANEARRGGGAWVDDSTFYVVGTPDATKCHPLSAFGGAEPGRDRYCAEFVDNRSTGEGRVDQEGGALFATNAEVVLREVGLQRNTADDDATALYVGGGAHAALRNVLVASASSGSVSVRVHEDATLNSRMSTFADEGATVTFDDGASGILHGDVFWSDGAGSGLVLNGTGVTGSCNVGEGDLMQLGPNNLLADPLFVTTLRGRYRLSNGADPAGPPVSPAMDVCNNGPAADLDGRSRPLPGPNLYDAGAFENGPTT